MKKLSSNVYILMSVLFVSLQACAVDKGSTVQVSIEPAFTFPTGQTNTMLGFGWFSNGFTLQDADTSCTFQSIFPVSGSIDLRGGTLYLDQNFICKNDTSFAGLGTVIGNGKTIELCSSITAIESPVIIENGYIELDSHLSLATTITLQGMVTIDGHGNVLTVGSSGALFVAPNSTVCLKNMKIKLNQGTIACCDDTGVLILDNVTWEQTGYNIFASGALQYKNDVAMKGEDANFVYQSTQPATILSHACVTFDEEFTFSYDPSALAQYPKDLFVFEDESAKLVLNGATFYAGLAGLNLIKGKLEIVRNSTISCATDISQEINEGITFGDGLSEANDLKVELENAVRLTLGEGALNYKNLLPASFEVEDFYAYINFAENTILRLYQSLDVNPGGAHFGLYTTYAYVSGMALYGSMTSDGDITFIEI